jgi:hypothetical protein
MAAVVFWPLTAALAFVVLLGIVWWVLFSQLRGRDDKPL